MKEIDVADCSSQSDRVVLTFSEEEGGGTVSVSASADHPFFVFGQGWSSPHPPASRDRWHTHTCGSISSSGDTHTFFYSSPCWQVQTGVQTAGGGGRLCDSHQDHQALVITLTL